MHQNRFSFFILNFLLLMSAATAACSRQDPRKKVETLIPEAIRLIESKDYTTMLHTMVPPEELKGMLQKSSMEELAQQFGKQASGDLLKALKFAQSIQPELDAGGRRAVYHLNETYLKNALVFVKIGDYWYLQE